MSSKAGTDRGVKEILIGLLLLMFILLVATLLSSAKAVEVAVKMGIESVDLGVKMSIQNAYISIWKGNVNVEKLVIENPEEHRWKSPCLMKIDQMVVKIDIWRLIKSLGSFFEVTACLMKHVTVNLEKKVGYDSNVEIVVKHIDTMIKQAAGWDKPVEVEVSPWPEKDNMQECSETIDKLINLKTPSVVLHALMIEDVGATALIEGKPVHVEIGNLDFPDFMKMMKTQFPGKEIYSVGDVVSIVVKLISHTIIRNKSDLIMCLSWGAQAQHSVPERSYDFNSAIAYSIFEKSLMGHPRSP